MITLNGHTQETVLQRHPRELMYHNRCKGEGSRQKLIKTNHESIALKELQESPAKTIRFWSLIYKIMQPSIYLHV